jgi:hypothetical protein
MIMSMIYMPIMLCFVTWKAFPHLKRAIGSCCGGIRRIWGAARFRPEMEEDPIFGFGEQPRMRVVNPNNPFRQMAQDLVMEMEDQL